AVTGPLPTAIVRWFAAAGSTVTTCSPKAPVAVSVTRSVVPFVPAATVSTIPPMLPVPLGSDWPVGRTSFTEVGVTDTLSVFPVRFVQTFPNESLSVTSTLAVEPAVTGDGKLLTITVATGPGVTRIVVKPVIPSRTSVAVTTSEPAVVSVTGNVPTPLVSV